VPCKGNWNFCRVAVIQFQSTRTYSGINSCRSGTRLHVYSYPFSETKSQVWLWDIVFVKERSSVWQPLVAELELNAPVTNGLPSSSSLASIHTGKNIRGKWSEHSTDRYEFYWHRCFPPSQVTSFWETVWTSRLHCITVSLPTGQTMFLPRRGLDYVGASTLMSKKRCVIFHDFITSAPPNPYWAEVENGNRW
jgi:hypothetical protein